MSNDCSSNRPSALERLLARAEIEGRRSEMPEDPTDGSAFIDARLLQRIRQRDERALVELVERYSPELARVAWLLLGERDAVEEVVQQTWLAAWHGAGRTSEKTTLGAWLIGILVRRGRDWQRREARRRRHENRAGELRVQQANTPTSPKTERLAEVRAAIQALPSRLREVVVLHYDEEMSVAQVSEALGVPLGTVKSRLRRAFQLLREELG